MLAAPLTYTPPSNRAEGDDRFIGLFTAQPAERLAPGAVQASANFCFGAGGDMVTRPPFIGQFTVPLASALYGAKEFYAPDGTLRIIFCSGTRIYYTVPGSATYTEITKTGGVAAGVSYQTFRATRHGKYLYFLDSAGNLCRTDTTTASVVTGVDAPTTAPSVQLSSRVINAFNDPSKWAFDANGGSQTANALTNGDLSSASNGTYGPATSNALGISGWEVTAGAVFIQTAGSSNTPYPSGTKYALLQQAGTQMRTASWITMPAVTNTNGVGSATRYVKHIRNAINGFFKQSPDSLLLEVLVNTASDGTGTTYVSPAFAANATSANVQGMALIRQTVADLSRFGIEPRAWKFQLTAGPTNQLGADGPYFTGAFAAPFEMETSVIGSGPLTFYGNLPNASNPALPVGGKMFPVDLGAATDLSKYANLTIPFSSSNFASPAAIRLRLGFRATTTSARYTTNLVTPSQDLTSLSVDISTIATANRNNVRYVDFVWDTDAPLAQPLPAGTSALFSLGSLTEAGTLSLINGVGYPYYYFYSWYNADTGASGTYPAIAGVESGGSPSSTVLTPTTQQAQALVSVPAPPTGATHILFWRLGGVFPVGADPRPRLLAFVPVGSDANDAIGWTWTASTRTLRDNVPDSALLTVLQFLEAGRNRPPSGCTDLVASDYRLWLAVKNQLWASWLLTDGEANALYFTQASDPTDPAVATKGEQFNLSSSLDSDTIVGMQPVGTTLHVLRQQSYNIVAGDNATNFSALAYLINAGVGLLARNGFCMAFGTRLWFLAAGGVFEFAENDQKKVSGAIETALTARTVAQADYQKAAFVAHDDGVYIFLPGICYVFDARTNSWTAWTGTPLTAPLSALSVAAQGNSHDLYVCGGDGQLYKLAGGYGQAVSGGDKATPTASAQPFAVTLKTRRYPAPGNQNQTANRLSLDLHTANSAGQAITWDLRAHATDPNAVTKNYALATGRNRFNLDSVGKVSGASHEVQLTASVSEPLRAYGVGLTLSDEGTRNG